MRVLPSLLEYHKRTGNWPQNLLCAFGALICFYKTGTPNDDADIMRDMKALSVREILARADWWGEDLSYLTEEVEPYAAEPAR